MPPVPASDAPAVKTEPGNTVSVVEKQASPSDSADPSSTAVPSSGASASTTSAASSTAGATPGSGKEDDGSGSAAAAESSPKKASLKSGDAKMAESNPNSCELAAKKAVVDDGQISTAVSQLEDTQSRGQHATAVRSDGSVAASQAESTKSTADPEGNVKAAPKTSQVGHASAEKSDVGAPAASSAQANAESSKVVKGAEVSVADKESLHCGRTHSDGEESTVVDGSASAKPKESSVCDAPQASDDAGSSKKVSDVVADKAQEGSDKSVADSAASAAASSSDDPAKADSDATQGPPVPSLNDDDRASALQSETVAPDKGGDRPQEARSSDGTAGTSTSTAKRDDGEKTAASAVAEQQDLGEQAKEARVSPATRQVLTSEAMSTAEAPSACEPLTSEDKGIVDPATKNPEAKDGGRDEVYLKETAPKTETTPAPAALATVNAPSKVTLADSSATLAKSSSASPASSDAPVGATPIGVTMTDPMAARSVSDPASTASSQSESRCRDLSYQVSAVPAAPSVCKSSTLTQAGGTGVLGMVVSTSAVVTTQISSVTISHQVTHMPIGEWCFQFWLFHCVIFEHCRIYVSSLILQFVYT